MHQQGQCQWYAWGYMEACCERRIGGSHLVSTAWLTPSAVLLASAHPHKVSELGRSTDHAGKLQPCAGMRAYVNHCAEGTDVCVELVLLSSQ